jgi:hypothetical protein
MGFTEKENIQMVKELNRKYKLNSKVVCHKKKYRAIYIPASDARTMREHLVYLPDCMKYKMPLVKKGLSALAFLASPNQSDPRCGLAKPSALRSA